MNKSHIFLLINFFNRKMKRNAENSHPRKYQSQIFCLSFWFNECSCSQTLQLFGNLHGKMRANRLLIIARLKWRPNGIPLYLFLIHNVYESTDFVHGHFGKSSLIYFFSFSYCMHYSSVERASQRWLA